MKRKHHGMISIVIIIVVLIPTAIYGVYSFKVPEKRHAAGLTRTSSEYSIPGKTVIKDISKLESKMAILANPIETVSVSDQSIRFWHYSDQNDSRYNMEKQKKDKDQFKAAYALTFTFSSGEKKYCIMDGTFYPQGADLPDGGKILKIDSGKVRVKKGESTRWIYLPKTAKWGEIQ